MKTIRMLASLNDQSKISCILQAKFLSQLLQRGLFGCILLLTTPAEDYKYHYIL